MKTQVGIVFGHLGVKVTFSINRKMVFRHELELEIGYCNQTWCIANLHVYIKNQVGIAFGLAG
jgi:hypothetical protein